MYGCQAPSAPTAYSIRVDAGAASSVAVTATLAEPTYAPSAFWCRSTFAEVSGAVVSSPPPSVTVRMPCIGPWPGIVQW